MCISWSIHYTRILVYTRYLSPTYAFLVMIAIYFLFIKQDFDLVAIPEDYIEKNVQSGGVPFMEAVKKSFDCQIRSFQVNK